MAAMFLKKVWNSVSNRSSSNSLERRHSMDLSLPLGAFEQVPSDILVQILKLLGPKETAKLSIVCKSWRSLVSDNRLWIYFLQTYDEGSGDSIFFAETYLRPGYPLPSPTLVPPVPELSFMHIYGRRAQVPGAVIIDGGSGYCKFGWSKYDRPSAQSATFMEFDTESAKAARQQLKEAIHASLFDMNVPAVCAINQATLALYAAKRTSGIVINIGFQVTSIVPILNGKVMHKVGVEVVGLGALKLTGFLRELMQQKNMNFESLYTVRTLKEKLCYVAVDYEAELLKDTQASFEAVGEGWFTLSKERFQTGEILFQPRMAGVQAMGLHQAVGLCMDHCHAAELADNSDWFKTVVLSGGTACLPGLAERLEKELSAYLPPHVANGIRVMPPPYGADTVWFGAKLIGNLSTFPGSWCITKKQFRQKSRLNLIW